LTELRTIAQMKTMVVCILILRYALCSLLKTLLWHVGWSLMFINIHILSFYKMFLYISLCQSVMLNGLSCSWTSILFLTNMTSKKDPLGNCMMTYSSTLLEITYYFFACNKYIVNKYILYISILVVKNVLNI
jgi:hypothetical protein